MPHARGNLLTPSASALWNWRVQVGHLSAPPPTTSLCPSSHSTTAADSRHRTGRDAVQGKRKGRFSLWPWPGREGHFSRTSFCKRSLLCLTAVFGQMPVPEMVANEVKTASAAGAGGRRRTWCRAEECALREAAKPRPSGRHPASPCASSPKRCGCPRPRHRAHRRLSSGSLPRGRRSAGRRGALTVVARRAGRTSGRVLAVDHPLSLTLCRALTARSLCPHPSASEQVVHSGGNAVMNARWMSSACGAGEPSSGVGAVFAEAGLEPACLCH